MIAWVTVLSALISLCSSSYLEFPVSFNFGAASSAYQVEGAWNGSDKGQSIWDHFTHTNSNVIIDQTNGDVACDSYHLWKRDVEIASELGLSYYRFSISWPRLLPDGYTNRVSEDGKKYYNNLIDGLLAKGVQPVVTLFHWDLPQNIQNLGGWTNPLVTDWFAEYARLVYSLYADRVKVWITLNEPLIFCDFSYSSGRLAPGVIDPKIAPYICNKYMLIAHAKAWRIYDEEFKPMYNGKVSIANHLVWYQPQAPEDKCLADLVTQFYIGRYTYPIYSEEGGWPLYIEDIMRDVSTQEGYPFSRLPPFTEDEIQLIQGTYDFFGINHYTSRLVRHATPGEDIIASPFNGVKELKAVLEPNPHWSAIGSDSIQAYPEGLRKQLVWLKENYGDIEVLITENGYSQMAKHSQINDQDRITFIKSYLEQVRLAIIRDGVKVTGYIYWALIDNFEWSSGYTSKFGLYEVDFSSPLRTRTPRASAHFYKRLIQNQICKDDDL